MGKSLAVAIALLACSGFTTPAHAFVFNTCGGIKVVWDDPFVMSQNTFSIKLGGFRESAFLNAVNRWRGVGDMIDMVSVSPIPNPSTTFGFDDGRNDVVVVKRADIGGANGLTAKIHDGCFIAGDMEYLEADVMAASDLAFGAVDETSLSSVSGRETFIHEFGHAHGLEHAQGFNNMRAAAPMPKVAGPGETVDVLPDDARGGRFLYPTFSFERNLFASAQRRDISSDTIVNNTSGTAVFCSGGGGSMTINATVGNNGTVGVTQTERWWLSKNANSGHSGGILIGQWNNSTFVSNTAFTRLITLTMPPVAPGLYFLFHGVDVFDVADESRENDNNVREGMMVEVIPC